MKRLKPNVRLSLGLAVALTLLAGCGSKGSDTGTAAVAAATSVVTAGPAPLPDWSGTWSMTEESRDTRVSGSNFRTLLTPKYASQLPQRGGRGGGPPPAGALAGARGGRGFGLGRNNNLTKCVPPGFPGNLTHPYAHEYLFTPGRVTMLLEDGETRRIYTDGRDHPAADDRYDSMVGHSIGHWEGTTLVVDTIGIRPEAELSLGGLHVTANTHVVEHIHKKDAKTMQIDTEITDPEIFTQPYAYTVLYERVPGDLMENACALDQRDNDDTIDLTPPPAER